MLAALDNLVNEPWEFPAGLPAFEEERVLRFVPPERPAPLLVLESPRTGGPQFLVIPVALIEPDYELELSAEDRTVLGWEAGDALAVLAVVALEEAGVTANLLAPVVLNARTRRGVQAVRWDTKYSHGHRLTGVPGCS